jgi:hypothetical protein
MGTFGTGAAIQAAIDQVAEDGSGTVYIPAGDWTCNTTLTIQPGIPTRLQGGGMGGIVGTGPTRLLRSSGTNTVISAIGTGQASANRVQVELLDLEVNGSGTAGNLVTIQRANECYLHRVKVKNAQGSGFWFRECWNCSADNLFVHVCGNGTTSPAMLLDAANATSGRLRDLPLLQLRVRVEQRHRRQADRRHGRPHPDERRPLRQREVRGRQRQRERRNSIGDSPYPYIDLAYAQNCSFNYCQIAVHHRRSVTPVQENRFNTGTRSNKFTNFLIDNTGNCIFPYFMQLTRGSWQCSNVNLVGAAAGPTTGGIRLESVNSGGHDANFFRIPPSGC